MNRMLSLILLAGSIAMSCSEKEVINSEFTGNEATYSLAPGSEFPIAGTVKIKERTDGTSVIQVTLSGTEGNIKHPVHLHLGNISTPDASVAALLNPVTGNTGLSETKLTRLADESTITYQELVSMNACIKVHLSDVGEGKNTILAGGNIGIAASSDNMGGRTGMRTCKSE